MVRFVRALSTSAHIPLNLASLSFIKALCFLLALSLVVLWPILPANAQSIELEWDAPTTNTDGSDLTDLAGYRIRYGLTQGDYTLGTLQIDDPAATSAIITTNIEYDTTYFFVATAINSHGRESSYSNEAEGMAPAPDADGDGVADSADNCPAVANANQADADNDGVGDACDANTDSDGDGIDDGVDCAPNDQTNYRNVTLYPDADGNGLADSDSSTVMCIGTAIPEGYTDNPSQDTPPDPGDDNDNDGDGISDLNDNDDDNDGLSDEQEQGLGTDSLNADTDADGSPDGQEVVDGSNPLDKGSSIPVLKTTICAEWNGFLGGMANIFEHVNMSSVSRRVQTTLYTIDGASASVGTFSIEPGAQFDLLVHDMEGRTTNSYGKVCSTHDGSEGDIDGRMVYYKTAADGFEFAFAMPMTNGKTGAQFVSFNTFQPSLDAMDAGNLVANWIQLTNLGDVNGAGTLSFYSMDGSVLGTQNVAINAGARRDFSGHQFGTQLVGVVAWTPSDESIPFQLRNVRYLYDNPNNQDSFDTAFQLEGMYGSGELLSVPLDTNGSSAIVEVSNVSDAPVEVDLIVYSSQGEVREELSFELAAFASRHVITDGILGLNQRGVATVRSSTASSLIAVAMHYGRNANLGINYMYGLPAVEALGTVLRSSYNTYLSQNAQLVLVNPTDEVVTASVSLVRSDGTTVAEIDSTSQAVGSALSVPAKGATVLNLSSLEVSNNYGVVTVQPESANSLIAWVLRERGLQYIMPTPVRQ